MHTAAVILMILAGLCCCAAAVLRWSLLARHHDDRGHPSPAANIFLWLGIGLLTGSVVAGLIDGQHLRFLYGAVAAWSALASLIFLTGFLAMPTPTLLTLPVGGMALLVALLAGLEQPDRSLADELSWITALHVLFVSAFSATLLISAAAGGLYLIAARQLKAGTTRSLRLPSLALLQQVTYIGLVIAVALLIGGVSTGGAAMRLRGDFVLLSPVPVLTLVDLGLLTALLAWHITRGLGGRGLATASLAMTSLLALTVIALFLDRSHG
ncbi:MAG: hypothetical protein ACOCXJ_02240 [Planctomycetota bacterium]